MTYITKIPLSTARNLTVYVTNITIFMQTIM